ncbi:SymE family type I addiction module toxin [Pectobacterium brasiliense]
MPPRRFDGAWGFWFFPHAIPSYSKKLHPPPATNLKGRWLEASGFITGV